MTWLVFRKYSIGIHNLFFWISYVNILTSRVLQPVPPVIPPVLPVISLYFCVVPSVLPRKTLHKIWEAMPEFGVPLYTHAILRFFVKPDFLLFSLQ